MITDTELMERLREIPGFKPHQDDGKIYLAFPTEHYVSQATGERRVLVFVRTEENGEYLKVFCPMAWKVRGRNVDDFLRACAMIQWKTKLIQFEYDESDGEVRPIIEWPIEDGTVTAKQLARAIKGIVGLVDRFAPLLDKAVSTGQVHAAEIAGMFD